MQAMYHWIGTFLPFLLRAGLTKAESANETILATEFVKLNLF